VDLTNPYCKRAAWKNLGESTWAKTGFAIMGVWIEAIGSVAAVTTTVCWVPQALKILREKRTEGLCLVTQILFTLGVALWQAYGLLLHNWPILLANAIRLVLSLAILVLKVRYH